MRAGFQSAHGQTAQTLSVFGTRIEDLEAVQQVEDPPPLGGSGAGGYLVKITSGGPGNSYVGDLYGNGPLSAATSTGVTVYQLQIDASATVPANTWALAVLIGTTYYVQVPVWL